MWWCLLRLRQATHTHKKNKKMQLKLGDHCFFFASNQNQSGSYTRKHRILPLPLVSSPLVNTKGWGKAFIFTWWNLHHGNKMWLQKWEQKGAQMCIHQQHWQGRESEPRKRHLLCLLTDWELSHNLELSWSDWFVTLLDALPPGGWCRSHFCRFS